MISVIQLVVSSLERLRSTGGVLGGASPVFSACSGLGMEGCGGRCRTVGDFARASGEDLLGSLSMSLTLDVIRSVSVGEIEVFRVVVFGVCGVLTLSLSFVF